jgi:hypothetical protein
MVTDAITEVYEKFKHLDVCLSDIEWCNAGGAAIYGIAGEMWRASKEEVERRKKDTPTNVEARLK